MSQNNCDEHSRLVLEVEKIEIDEYKHVEQNLADRINRIKECLTINNLTRNIVVELIDKIEVSEINNNEVQKIRKYLSVLNLGVYI